jgi:hypothetical protein
MGGLYLNICCSIYADSTPHRQILRVRHGHVQLFEDTRTASVTQVEETQTWWAYDLFILNQIQIDGVLTAYFDRAARQAMSPQANCSMAR